MVAGSQSVWNLNVTLDSLHLVLLVNQLHESGNYFVMFYSVYRIYMYTFAQIKIQIIRHLVHGKGRKKRVRKRREKETNVEFSTNDSTSVTFARSSASDRDLRCGYGLDATQLQKTELESWLGRPYTGSLNKTSKPQNRMTISRSCNPPKKGDWLVSSHALWMGLDILSNQYTSLPKVLVSISVHAWNQNLP